MGELLPLPLLVSAPWMMSSGRSVEALVWAAVVAPAPAAAAASSPLPLPLFFFFSGGRLSITSNVRLRTVTEMPLPPKVQRGESGTPPPARKDGSDLSSMRAEGGRTKAAAEGGLAAAAAADGGLAARGGGRTDSTSSSSAGAAAGRRGAMAQAERGGE